MTPKRIFVLDDDADVAEVMAQGLAAPGREVRAFQDPVRAMAALEREPVDLLIADVKMPWLDGGEVIDLVRRRQPGLQVLLVSGFDEGADLAARANVNFLAKPVDLGTLRRAVATALDDPSAEPPGDEPHPTRH